MRKQTGPITPEMAKHNIRGGITAVICAIIAFAVGGWGFSAADKAPFTELYKIILKAALGVAYVAAAIALVYGIYIIVRYASALKKMKKSNKTN